MLYTWLELGALSIAPWRAGARAAALARPWDPFARAAASVTETALMALEGGGPGLLDAVRRDAAGPFGVETLATHPFWRLERFATGGARPTVLLVPPHSGFPAAVASPLVAALLLVGDVAVLDWTDARGVPIEADGFGIEDQVEAVRGALRRAGPIDALIGLSQSGPAALAAAALLAEDGDPAAPGRVALLGTPIDTGRGDTPLQAALAMDPADLLPEALLGRVPGHYVGRGRIVYPAFLQLAAYAALNPALYAEAQAAAYAEALIGHPGVGMRLHHDLHRLIDVPGELFVETFDLILRQNRLARGTLEIGGRAVCLESLRATPLLTIEAGADELVGRGQTHAAQGLCQAPGRAVTLPNRAHHALFTGPDFVDTAKVLLPFLG